LCANFRGDKLISVPVVILTFLTRYFWVQLQRLQAKIIKVVDVSYGGENGFNQAIELAADALDNVKFIQEKKLIGMNFSFTHTQVCQRLKDDG